MHASHGAVLGLAASATLPALSVPLTSRIVHATSGVVARGLAEDVVNGDIQLFPRNLHIVAPAPGKSIPRDVVDDVTTKVLQLFSGNIVTRDLGDSFQSVPTVDGLSSGPLNLKDLQDPRLAVATGRRSIVDDALNTIAGLFGGGGDPGVLLGRDGVDFVREITRRQCEDSSLLSGNTPTFLPPVGACDGFILNQEAKNIQFDPDTISTREAGDLSAMREMLRQLRNSKPDVATRSRSLNSLD
ncbi:hypothetical protein H4582DRAFT_2071624 [Lactarius indigo]|nr:hypothetical protein H4582DRAFT_2071624 [Lactarius indigo]